MIVYNNVNYQRKLVWVRIWEVSTIVLNNKEWTLYFIFCLLWVKITLFYWTITPILTDLYTNIIKFVTSFIRRQYTLFQIKNTSAWYEAYTERSEIKYILIIRYILFIIIVLRLEYYDIYSLVIMLVQLSKWVMTLKNKKLIQLYQILNTL